MHSIKHTNNVHRGALLYALLITFSLYSKPRVTISQKNNVPHTLYITFFFDLKPKDYLYKDFLHFSVDHPSIMLSQWQTDAHSVTIYDPTFKNHKQLFNTPCTLTITVTKQEELDIPIHLYCTYFQKSEKKIKQIVTPLLFPQKITQKNDVAIIQNDYAQHNQQENNTYVNTLYAKYSTTFYAILHTYKARLLQIPHAPFVIGCIMIIILMGIMIAFLFLYRHHQTLLIEYVHVSGNIILCICMYFVLMCSTGTITPLMHYIMHSMLLVGIGVFFTHKSTLLQSHLLRKICTLIGFAAIAAVVFVCFKTYQIIEFYL